MKNSDINKGLFVRFSKVRRKKSCQISHFTIIFFLSVSAYFVLIVCFDGARKAKGPANGDVPVFSIGGLKKKKKERENITTALTHLLGILQYFFLNFS